VLIPETPPYTSQVKSMVVRGQERVDQDANGAPKKAFKQLNTAYWARREEHPLAASPEADTWLFKPAQQTVAGYPLSAETDSTVREEPRLRGAARREQQAGGRR